MQASRRLFQACRITLFARDNCGLCVRAKSALSHVWDTRPFVYKEVDIVKPSHKAWKDIYDFDVPVIHISKAQAPEEDPALVSEAVKLMHRFTPDDIKATMDEVEASP